MTCPQPTAARSSAQRLLGEQRIHKRLALLQRHGQHTQHGSMPLLLVLLLVMVAVVVLLLMAHAHAAASALQQE